MKVLMKIFREKRWMICAVCACIVTIILAFVYQEYFRSPYEESLIIIKDTATKNKNSWGSDVRIRSIKIDGREIKFEELEKVGEWEYLDNLLVSVNPSTPTQLVYKTQNAKKIEIELQKQEGSGIVEFYENNKKIGTIDLYSPEYEEVVFRKELGGFSLTRNWHYLLIIYLVAFNIVFFSFKMLFARNEQYIKKLLLDIKIITILLLIGGLCFEVVWKELLAIWLTMFAVFAVLAEIATLGMKKFKNIFLEKLYTGCILTGTAIILFLLVERITGSDFSWEIQYVIGNIIIYEILVILIMFAVKRLSIAILISTIISLGFALANYYVTKFRGTPIVPGDFLVAGTALEVFKNYNYTINWEIFSTLVLGCGLIWAVLIVRTRIEEKSVEKILFWVFPVTVAISIVIGTDYFKPELDLWNLNNNTNKYGVAMSMVSNIRRMGATIPESYSLDEIEQLSLQYKENIGKDFFAPNIIVVMNESFSDLKIIDNDLEESNYMPFCNSLTENTIKGFAFASTFGGGTANTEYEFLTSNTMAFIPGTVPYQQLVNKKSYSLVGLLKNRGYSTIAIHPYGKEGYNRYKVYSQLGFDQFMSIEDFTNPDLERNLYVTDEESYKKIIEVFEQHKMKENPVFIFNVTIQNHSGYETGFFGKDVITVPGYEGVFPDLEEYLTLVKKSDEAFSMLVDYFRNVDEPTVILIFGDHQPKISDDFYTTMFSKPFSEWTLEEIQKRYQVPFIIWTNYDIEEKKDIITSMNYLSGLLFRETGIAKSPYQNYLQQISEQIPAININGYLGDDGLWHNLYENNKYREILDMYWKVQYNNIYAKHKCENLFVDN